MTVRRSIFASFPRKSGPRKSGPRKSDLRKSGGPGDAIDFVGFVVLFALGLLFEIQQLLPIVASVHLRQALIALLFLALLLRADSWRRVAPASLLLFLALCAAVGGATALRFGPALAAAGFARFVNAAVLAAFAAQLVTTRARLRLLVMLWFAVILIGLGTTLYQLAGGDMPWLVGDYYSGRGNLLRYKTILGDPNVGGMAAAITLIGGLVLARPPWSKLVIAALSLMLIVLSLSKAALALGGIGLVVLALIERPRLVRFCAARPLASAIAATAMLAGIAAASTIPALSRYETVGIETLVGANGAAQGALHDIADRAFLRVERGIALLAAMPPSPLLNYAFGGSYGIAGSVAVSARGEPAAFLPHNGYLEIFLVGGLVLLAAFLAVVARTARNLLPLWRSDVPEAKFMIVALIILLVILGGYPIMYEPILGSLFWLIVGASFNAARWAAGDKPMGIAQDHAPTGPVSVRPAPQPAGERAAGGVASPAPERHRSP
jgi:hypothetical protein